MVFTSGVVSLESLGNHNGRIKMTKRIHGLAVAVAAVAALALGGAVIAQAQVSHSAAHERVSAPDRDYVQSGDQTTPDSAKRTAANPRHRHTRAASTTAVGSMAGGNVHSGRQTTPDSGSQAETPGAENPESGSGSESAPANDGPGGH